MIPVVDLMQPVDVFRGNTDSYLIRRGPSVLLPAQHRAVVRLSVLNTISLYWYRMRAMSLLWLGHAATGFGAGSYHGCAVVP